jgi:succinate dehydrogenase assembly factor 2
MLCSPHQIRSEFSRNNRTERDCWKERKLQKNETRKNMIRCGVRVVSRLSLQSPRQAVPVCFRHNNAVGGDCTGASHTCTRWYRGDSGDMKSRSQVVEENNQDGAVSDAISEREEALLKIAKPRYDAIYSRHIQFPELKEGMDSSITGINADGVMSKEAQELAIRKKRLIYRAKQRGWLEVDLLLGTWAHQNVPGLTIDELDEFEHFVNLETIDIYNVLTLRTDIPEEFKDESLTGVVRNLQTWAKSHPLGRAEPEKYAKVKQENNLI